MGGVDINEVDPEVLLSDYSMVFQDVVLFDDSIKENIRLGKRNATDEEVYKAAKAANCDEFVQKLPDGYDTLIVKMVLSYLEEKDKEFQSQEHF